ncbi:Membrane alanine aminopeptidase N [Methanosarcina mazei Tuc01]|uniref:Membrane alanine aminopeptidase N n=1 Tax=Methanosarcina mazei Tuc01 TaxID=1236903 RepID=M1Q0C1_METMZ|nr:M1 family metallopeptidase [Methanosarcina mazei]AGF95730.1 Membrane alanine aminopeptidase N [Methanosarcina mazei Tuc01]
MNNRLYKYYPEDFGELKVDVLHMDLTFDIYDDRTNVKSILRVRTKDEPIEKLELNCKDLEIRAVSCFQSEVSYRYRKDDAILEISFRDLIPPNTEIAVITDTVCRPTKNILEGLYYDETPAGAPPQQITQCQQWGFQRIVPCIDDMTAKCTYRTTIIADSRYTNLITNGDVAVERHTVKPGRDKIVYDNSVTPMATYLFFLGVGTYAAFKREFEYPDGSTFMLELLVPPDSDARAAEKALDILHDCVMWVYVFTGPEHYDEDRLAIRQLMWDLVRRREKLKIEAKPRPGQGEDNLGGDGQVGKGEGKGERAGEGQGQGQGKRAGEGEGEGEGQVRAALVDESGKDIVEVLERVSGETAEIVIENVGMPSFLSLNRGYSFYGKLVYRASQEELLMQVRKDSDIVGRFTAFYTFVDREKLRLLRVPGSAPSEDFIELYYRLLNDRQLLERAGGQFLTIFESVEDEEFAHHYQALYDVKQKLLKAVAGKYRSSLISAYNFFENASVPRDGSLEETARVIKSRQAKNICLGVLATLDAPDIHALIKQQFETATCTTDRLSAFAAYLNSSAPDKIEVLRAFEAESKKNLIAWEAFLSVIGSNSSVDAVELVREMERSDAFRIEQTNDQRALYGSFARNRKKSLETEEGRVLFAEVLRKLAPVNEYTTVNLLNAFANIDQMEIKYHIPLVKILADLLAELDPQKYPSVYNRIRKLLLGAPAAVEAYGIVQGKIPALQT